MFLITLFFLVVVVASASSTRVTADECVEIRKNHTKTGIDRRIDATHITPGLYIGNVCAAHNDEWLDREGITAVISMSFRWNDLPYQGKRVVKFYHMVNDSSMEDEDNEERVESLVRRVGLLIHKIIYSDRTSREKVLLFDHIHISQYSKIVRWYIKYFPIV
jgi:hypothetical protein